MTTPNDRELQARIGETLRAQEWRQRFEAQDGMWITEAELSCFIEDNEVYDENIEWTTAYVYAESALLKAMTTK